MCLFFTDNYLSRFIGMPALSADRELAMKIIIALGDKLWSWLVSSIEIYLLTGKQKQRQYKLCG